MEKIITKQELNKSLDLFIKSKRLIAPKQEDEELTLFKAVDKKEEIAFDYLNTRRSVKEFFFPQNEEIFSFKEELQRVKLAPKTDTKDLIVFGARPCDARGLFVLDKLFSQDYEDILYLKKRDSITIIGLACNSPDWACFCASLGGSPHSIEGLDILLTTLEDGKIFAQILTDKGKKIMGSFGSQPNKEDYTAKEDLKQKAEAKITKRVRKDPDLEAIFDDPYWYSASRACLSCGVCTYLCPTCHCFDLTDEARMRLRCWDGCAFPNFTLQASGENPRYEKSARYRQRVLHKFDYFRKNFDINLCVGCGRCIRHCPVRIDIAEVVNNAPVK